MLTKQYPNGQVTIDAHYFEQTQETIDSEVRNSPAFTAAVERLREYETFNAAAKVSVNELIKKLNSSELFLRNRADAEARPLNEYDTEIMYGISELINKTIAVLERAIVPPCKVGDTVYVINGKAIKEAKIYEMVLDKSDHITMLVNFECDYECDKCPFNSWTQEHSGEYSCGGEYGESSITSSDFGEIAFLNKEEAAAKLAEVK